MDHYRRVMQGHTLLNMGLKNLKFISGISAALHTESWIGEAPRLSTNDSSLIQNICHAGELSSFAVPRLIEITAALGAYLKIC